MNESWLTMWVIYRRPKDYPEHFVLRRWLSGPGVTVPDPIGCLAATIHQARCGMPNGVSRMPKFADDDPAIAEVWM